ncbi:MAG: hypothetical protein MZV70_49440 [Desulfobacterales bacterium]|nr:hypothetical protein [Desulfobacterales bacterium]
MPRINFMASFMTTLALAILACCGRLDDTGHAADAAVSRCPVQMGAGVG